MSRQANMKADAKPLQAREKGKPIEVDRQLCILRYSPCGKFLVAGDFEGRVRRWDASGDKLVPLPSLEGHHGWVQCVAFTPDGKVLLSADSWGRLVGWAMGTEAPRVLWALERAHEGWIRKLAVAPNGTRLATCGVDGMVRLWSTQKGEKLQEVRVGEDLLALAFHPDGRSIVSGDLKGNIRRHEIASGKPLGTFDATAMYKLDRIQDVGGVRCLAFDPTGSTLVAGGCEPTTGGFVQGAGLLLYFDVATGKPRQPLKIGGTNDGYVHDLVWHPAGFVLAVTSGQPGQGKFLLHRPGEATPSFVTTKMPNCLSLALHPGGKRVVVASTNAGSSGNGRPTTAGRSYPGNRSPLWTWEIEV